MAGTGTAHLRGTDHDVVLHVDDLVVEFTGRGGTVHAVSGISFDVLAGETLGLVGESGCGKSSTGRALLQLPPPTSGAVWFEGVDLTTLSGKQLRRTRSRLQMIFQDPISSLNPRRKVREIVGEGPTIWGDDLAVPDDRVDEILEAVGLDPQAIGDRFPHEFSGGQCQRICIARALVMNPKVLICDEPVSALDVSVQAQILNVIADLKQRYRLTMVFIAHDLAVVKNVSDRIVVMYLGKICEVAASDDLFAAPAHPYTRVLLASIPEPDPFQQISDLAIAGDLPSPMNPPSGCRFRTRCPRAHDRCETAEPEITEIRPGHFVACHAPHVGRDDALPVAIGP